MKTTILKISVFLLLFSLMGAGCEKDATLKNGKIVFYTNAQALLNCGPFNVDIFINDDLVGSISESYVEETYPECVNSNATLLVEKKTGKYNYTAKMNCGQYGSWVHEVEVYSDSCVYVFLDMDDCIIKTN